MCSEGKLREKTLLEFTTNEYYFRATFLVMTKY